MRLRFSLATLLLLMVGGVAFLFLALPQVVLLLRGLQTRGWEGLPQTGILEAITLSLLTTLLSSLITFLFGMPLAWLLARWRFAGRRLLIVLVELPIVLPPTVAGLALLITLGRRGVFGQFLRGFGISLPFTNAAVILAQCFVAAPFFIRAAMVGFSTIPREIEDAARVDGAGGLTLFRWVILPLCWNALAAGLTLSWARALGEFGATILFAGSLAGRTQTMPLLVYNILESNLDTAIWASLVLLVLAFMALVFSQWLARRAENLF